VELKQYLEDRCIPVTETGCWLWMGCYNKQGYGICRRPITYAHRASYVAFVGPIPLGLLVLHSCDTPSCINPAHLRVGTQKENMRDRDRQRHRVAPKGERHNGHRLTESQVLEIKKLSHHINKTAVGRYYGVSRVTISNVIRNKAWKHVEV
jgi:hypothetical protein